MQFRRREHSPNHDAVSLAAGEHSKWESMRTARSLHCTVNSDNQLSPPSPAQPRPDQTRQTGSNDGAWSRAADTTKQAAAPFDAHAHARVTESASANQTAQQLQSASYQCALPLSTMHRAQRHKPKTWSQQKAKRGAARRGVPERIRSREYKSGTQGGRKSKPASTPSDLPLAYSHPIRTLHTPTSFPSLLLAVIINPFPLPHLLPPIPSLSSAALVPILPFQSSQFAISLGRLVRWFIHPFHPAVQTLKPDTTISSIPKTHVRLAHDWSTSRLIVITLPKDTLKQTRRR